MWRERVTVTVVEARMSGETGRMDELRLLGERLCLNFANTVDPRHSDHPREFLATYADLVAWARRADALTQDEGDHLLHEATRRPADATAVFHQARALREAVYTVFSALARGASPAEATVAMLNDELSAALSHARVAPSGAAFVWAWEDNGPALDRMLWPVARSAADLLTSGCLGRVRECPGEDGCGWLFLDTSKNGSRRWCSMEGCGNRSKARRYHARRQTGSMRRGG